MPSSSILPLLQYKPAIITLSNKFLVGVSTTSTRGQTTAQSMSATEAICGHQSIHRDYANSTYTNFMLSQRALDVDTTNKVSIRTTHVSWNPLSASLQSENPPNASTQFSGFNPTQLQNYLKNGSGDLTTYGTETQKNIQWLLSIPTYQKVVLNPWHEADNYQTSNDYGTNYGQFRNAFRILADIIHTFNNPNWKVCLLLTAYAWKGSSGSANNPSNFYPCWSGYPQTGTNYVDVMGVDVYNEGSVAGTYWDSPGACIGMPMNSSEQSTYQSRYGGTYGYKTSDGGTLTWSNGFLGWCEAYGITQWLVGEIGSQRNINNLTASWNAALGITTSKNDWIREFGRFAYAYSNDPTHNARCFALEYFMSAGRKYSGSNYLTTAVHYTTNGTLFPTIVAAVATSSALPSNLTSGDSGKQYLTTDTTHIWQWSGTAYSDLGASLTESWQLWWNDDGSGWDAANSAYYGWKDVTTNYALSS